MEKDEPHCFDVENVLVVFHSNFGAQLFEYSYVFPRKELRSQKLNWLEGTQSHINFEKLAFVKRAMVFDFKLIQSCIEFSLEFSCLILV